jgi:glycosyltransferase involved in cell wall biosynthesis
MEISVIMSVYNHEKFLSHSIKSILNQTFKNVEFLIIDDGSTDNSYKILKRYESLDRRIKVFKNTKNIGLTRSLNKLIRHTSSKYIARQDSDDFSMPDRLKTQHTFLTSSNYEACTSRALTKHNMKILPRYSYYLPKKILLKYKNPFVHGSLMISKKLINEVGNYDERFIYSQDYKLVSDIYQNKNKIKILKPPMYVLNMRDNISSKFTTDQKYYAKCVQKRIIPKT